MASRVPTRFGEAEGNIMSGDKREPFANRAQSQTPGARLEIPCARTGRPHGRPAAVGRTGWRRRRAIRPARTPVGSRTNREYLRSARTKGSNPLRRVEGSGSTKGNTEEAHTRRTQG